MATTATTTTTPTVDADHRPTGRPVGTYTTDAGVQRRVWRQRGRDGVRLVDVALSGRGRRYLIECALTAGEAEALACRLSRRRRPPRRLPDAHQPRRPGAGGGALMPTFNPTRAPADRCETPRPPSRVAITTRPG